MEHLSIDLRDRPAAGALPLALQKPACAVWALTRHQATELCRREPFLQAQVEYLILGADSLTHSLARVVAWVCGTGLDTHALAMELCEVVHDVDLFEDACARDLMAICERDPACCSHLHAILNLKGFQAMTAHRFAHRFWRRGRKELSHWLSNRSSRLLGVDIHPAASMGWGIMLDHASGIVIGETAIVDNNVSILQGVTLGGTGKERGLRHPRIREGVMIGAGAKVLGRIEVGEGAKIAAGSVVLQSVPAKCTVAGVPARVMRGPN